MLTFSIVNLAGASSDKNVRYTRENGCQSKINVFMSYQVLLVVVIVYICDTFLIGVELCVINLFKAYF